MRNVLSTALILAAASTSSTAFNYRDSTGSAPVSVEVDDACRVKVTMGDVLWLEGGIGAVHLNNRWHNVPDGTLALVGQPKHSAGSSPTFGAYTTASCEWHTVPSTMVTTNSSRPTGEQYIRVCVCELYMVCRSIFVSI